MIGATINVLLLVLLLWLSLLLLLLYFQKSQYRFNRKTYFDPKMWIPNLNISSIELTLDLAPTNRVNFIQRT